MPDRRVPQHKRLISLVIPIFNEEDGVDQLRERLGCVRDMWRETADVEFVFVDDGSSDKTRHALHEAFGTDPLSQIAIHGVNRGIGAAFRTGFARSRGSIVCTIDADCSYGPENLQRLTVALDEQDADIAVASPYHPQGTVEGVPSWRLLLSKSCSIFYRVVAPVRLHTYTSVFRAYRKNVVEAVPFQEDGFVSATEVLIRAAEQGYRITEVPMTLHARKIGRTKMKVLRTIRGHARLIGTTAVRRIQSALKTGPSVAARGRRSEPSQVSDLHR
jgi:dolichol-phosphate mannosyltransferase